MHQPACPLQACRSDRGTLRLALNPAAAVRIAMDSQLWGLPLLQLSHRCAAVVGRRANQESTPLACAAQRMTCAHRLAAHALCQLPPHAATVWVLSLPCTVADAVLCCLLCTACSDDPASGPMLLVQLQQDSPAAPDTCPMTQLLPLAPAPVHMCLTSASEACAHCSKLHPGLLEGAVAQAAGAAAGPGPAGASGGAETGPGVSHGSGASASSAPVWSWSSFRSEALRCCTQRARLLLSKRRMSTAAGDALDLEAAGEGFGADVMGGARGPVAAAGGLAAATSAFVKCNGCSMGGIWSDIRCSEGEKRGGDGTVRGEREGDNRGKSREMLASS